MKSRLRLIKRKRVKMMRLGRQMMKTEDQAAAVTGK